MSETFFIERLCDLNSSFTIRGGAFNSSKDRHEMEAFANHFDLTLTGYATAPATDDADLKNCALQPPQIAIHAQEKKVGDFAI
jgi:hypothetical protein